MNNEEYLKWIIPSIKSRSINVSNFRFEKAMEQAKMTIIEDRKVIEYVNEFLKIMEMETTYEMKFDPIVTLEKEKRSIKYAEIAKNNQLEDKRDIVWIRLTKGGYVSVIGTGCDISFTDWAKDNTTSGRISEYLKKNPPYNHTSEEFEWNSSFVLIFPLKGIKYGLNRSDIESGIGNYLIYKGVPILDYFSHNY